MDVKGLRKRLGLSQDGLARKLGVAPYTVRRWEKGKTTPSPLAREKLEFLLHEIEDTPGTEKKKGG